MSMRRPWWGAAAAALAVLAIAGTVGAQAAPDETPYFMLGDPMPSNPAAVPWRVMVLTGGPVAAEISSNKWSVGDVAAFVSNLAAGRDAWGGLALAPGETEELGWVAGGRAQANIVAFQLSYGLVTTGSGSLTEGFVRLMREASAGKIEGGEYPLEGTNLRGQAWQDLALRANAPVPIIPRFFGLRKLSVGVGVHFLSGVHYFDIGASGTVNDPDAKPQITFLQASQAQGRAFDVGVAASLSRRLSVEAAYVGAGALNWTGVKTATITEGNIGSLDSPPWEEAPPFTYDLPAVALVGVHLRPLPVGLLQLSGYYAIVGVNRPEPAFTRLQGEASVSALGLVRASLGAAKDSNEQQARVYGSMGVGLGAIGLTVRATNLQEIAKGTHARSLGLAVMGSLGF
ncbi:MAG: hypothetical protein AB1609_13715 [Bacillota bacterium]